VLEGSVREESVLEGSVLEGSVLERPVPERPVRGAVVGEEGVLVMTVYLRATRRTGQRLSILAVGSAITARKLSWGGGA
jgi:hypothetical protein